MDKQSDAAGETPADHRVNPQMVQDSVDGTPSPDGKSATAPTKEKSPEITSASSAEHKEQRASQLYSIKNLENKPEDIGPLPVLTPNAMMPSRNESGGKLAVDTERDDDHAVYVDAVEYMEHPSNSMINHLATRGETLDILQQCAKAQRPYTLEEAIALLRPTMVLKHHQARYVPQWDEQLVGDAVPQDIDYRKPPKKHELAYDLMHKIVCQGADGCWGITWLYSPKTDNEITIHPQHPSYLKHHHNPHSTMVVQVASEFVPKKKWRKAQMGICALFSLKSRYNIIYNLTLNEIFWPLVDGKPAETAPPGHRYHGLKMNRDLGQLVMALCALRVVERRIVPKRLQQLVQSFHGDRQRPDKTLGVREAGHLRVVIETSSTYLVNTICNVTYDFRNKKMHIPERKEGEDASASASGMSRAERAEMRARKALAMRPLSAEDTDALLVTNREPSGDNFVYVVNGGTKMLRNTFAITALEAQIDLLASMGVQVKFLLVPPERVKTAYKLAKNCVSIDPAMDEKCKRTWEKWAATERGREALAKLAAQKAEVRQARIDMVEAYRALKGTTEKKGKKKSKKKKKAKAEVTEAEVTKTEVTKAEKGKEREEEGESSGDRTPTQADHH